jgi:hypothetical protein
LAKGNIRRHKATVIGPARYGAEQIVWRPRRSIARIESIQSCSRCSNVSRNRLIAIPDSTSFECKNIEYFLVENTRHATYRWRILRGGVARCSLRLGLSVCSGSVIRAVLCWLLNEKSIRDGMCSPFISPPSRIRGRSRMLARNYRYRTSMYLSFFAHEWLPLCFVQILYIYIYILYNCHSQSSVAQTITSCDRFYRSNYEFALQVHESISRAVARCLMHVTATRGQDSPI